MTPPISTIELVLGVAITFSDEDAPVVYDYAQKHGVKWIDTARRYPGSETQIAEHGAGKKFRLTTKFFGLLPGSGKRESILKSAEESLATLGVDKVDIILLHGPDPTVPISETLDAVQEVYKKGCFERFGLSNFTPSQVQEAYDYAKSKSYILPSVYQVNYNLIARHHELELFPLLRSLRFTIQAYSPIAGGFLVKSASQITNPPLGNRWHPSSRHGPLYQGLYNKPSLLAFLDQFGEIAEESGVGKVGLAYRWTRYHSALSGENGDMLIFGATSQRQVEETLDELEKGPLEGWVVERLNDMWKGIEKDAPRHNVDK